MGQNTERFAEHVKTRAVQPPQLLYKYTSVRIASLVIQTGRVRFQSPLRYNDPFDGQWDTFWQVGTPEFNKALAKRIVASDFDLSRVRDPEIRAEFERERSEYVSLQSESDQRAYVERVANSLDRGIIAEPREPNLLRRMRIFCLAAVPDSIQMWSYYGDDHKGVLLAFNTRMLESFWEIPAEEVEYSEMLPEVIDTAMHLDYYLDAAAKPVSDHQRIVRALTLTKASGWSHEKEWRFASLSNPEDTREFDHFPFPAEACVGIAAGCRTDMAAFDDLVAELLAKQPGAQFWQLARHARRFDLVARPYSK